MATIQWSEHKARLEWLRGQRRQLVAEAEAALLARNWAGLVETATQVIDCEAEIRGMECKR